MKTALFALVLLILTPISALAAPHSALDRAVVFTMAEMTDNPRALDMARQAGSELLIRGWFKWRQAPRMDRLHSFADQAHAFGALFGGGITCSALYDGENGLTRAQLLEMATRGPGGDLLDAWGQRGIRHGSLSSPAYQDYLFRWCREQIDAGADYLFMDEINAALGPREGYDDASLADFRLYLTTACPQTRGFAPADPRWATLYHVDLANAALCPGGSIASFDYRAFLRVHNFLEKPTQPANALAPFWQAFRLWRDDRAWHALTDRIRAYAAQQGRTVLLSGNGLAKYVDLQVLGVWGQWSAQDGHIDLAENKLTTWHSMVQRGRVLAGRRVPVVFFHDWGFGTPPFPWLAVPPREREVWMRTAGAELYAAGAFFAFPVLGPMGCDSQRDGTLPTIASQSAFYRAHRDLYLGADFLGAETPRSATPNLSLAAWARPDRRAVILHAVNRNLADHALALQKEVTVTLPLDRVPARAAIVSPDFAGERPAACKMVGGKLEVALGDLAAYDVAILTFDAPVSVDALRDPARTVLTSQWEPTGRSEFRVLPDGAIEDASDLSGTIQGMLHTELRNPPTFLVNAAREGRFQVHVRAVATLGARLEWRVDGQTVQTLALPDLDHKNDSQAREYDKTITFPIPKGRHKITLDNTGGDWLSADWVAFEGSFE